MAGKHRRELKDEKWLRLMYETKGKTVHEIGALINCAHSSVARALHRLGIKPRGRLEGDAAFTQTTCPECGTVFPVGGRDQPKRSARYCSHHCHMLNQNPRQGWSADRPREKRDKIRNEQWLREHYLDKKWSSVKIARFCSCSIRRVCLALKAFGIPIRSIAEQRALVVCERGDIRFDDSSVDRTREANFQYRQRLKAEMVAAYGGKCECCGETEVAFLSLDHIDGGGHKIRRSKGGHAGMLRRLKAQGWPKDGLRCLCMNCNVATKYGRTCPHQLKKENP